jgi:hypothetical protein
MDGHRRAPFRRSSKRQLRRRGGRGHHRCHPRSAPSAYVDGLRIRFKAAGDEHRRRDAERQRPWREGDQVSGRLLIASRRARQSAASTRSTMTEPSSSSAGRTSHGQRSGDRRCDVDEADHPAQRSRDQFCRRLRARNRRRLREVGHAQRHGQHRGDRRPGHGQLPDRLPNRLRPGVVGLNLPAGTVTGIILSPYVYSKSTTAAVLGITRAGGGSDGPYSVDWYAKGR